MLITPERRDLRRRFGALLVEVQEQRSQNRHRAFAAVAKGDGAAGGGGKGGADERAGVLGWLPPELVCAVLAHVVRLSPLLRCGVELHEASRRSIIDLARAVRSCAYVHGCFVQHGDVLRLEVAARGCTTLMPIDAETRTPYLKQVLGEERSRFDVRMLESALVAAACHCAGEHCRSVRRAHNETIGSPLKRRGRPARAAAEAAEAAQAGAAAAAAAPPRPQTPLLAAVLAGRRPRLKVGWPNNVVAIAAAAATSECALVLRTRQPPPPAAPVLAFAAGAAAPTTTIVNSVLCLRDAPPETFIPNTELLPLRRLDLHRSDAAAGAAPPPNILHVATSACGGWLAVHEQAVGPDRAPAEPRQGSVRTWRFDERGAAHELAPLPYRSATVYKIWFRAAAPYNLCVVASRHADAPHAFVGFVAPGPVVAPRWGEVGVHQFPVDGAVLNCSASPPPRFEPCTKWHRTLLKPIANTHAFGRDHVAWGQISDYALLFESTLMDVSVASSGSCVAAVVCGASVSSNASGTSFRLENVIQVVFHECPIEPLGDDDWVEQEYSLGRSRIRYAIDNDAVKPITGQWCEDAAVLRDQQCPVSVDLSPCGDSAVVLLQAANGEFFVRVHVRLSAASGFVLVRLFRLEDAIQPPPTRPPEPHGPPPARRTVRTEPSMRAFSPCGRFLLLGFGFGESNAVANLRSCKPGLCLLDLCDLWSHASAVDAQRHANAHDGSDVAWIECRADLLPVDVAWNGAGLWLHTKQGVLLLGM